MNFTRSESGTALIEFALFLPMMLFIFVGIVDYALEIQQAMQVQEAATAGASYGAIPGKQKDKTGMQNAATGAGSNVSGMTVVASYFYKCTPGGAAVLSSTICSGYGTPIMYVQVQTSATVSPMLTFNGITSHQPLQGSAIFRVPWTP